MHDLAEEIAAQTRIAAARLGQLPQAPMAFPVQDLTGAPPVDRPGLFWRLWGAIAQRSGQ